jgi:hypothetical protein
VGAGRVRHQLHPCYIPDIAFIIGLVPPALLALLQGGPQLAALGVLVYVVINFVIQSVISRSSSVTPSTCHSP